jgi:uncharacterized protein YceK
MRKIIPILIIVLILSGCASNGVVPLTEEPVETFDVEKRSSEPVATDSEETGNATAENIKDKFSIIGFHQVSGVYSRKVLEGEAEVVEMFSLEKHNFIRMKSGEFEREIFAYNYLSDDFTYLYYFNGELMAKTIMNIDTGAVMEDEDEYAPLLESEAEAVKQYFNDLIVEAGIGMDELN